MNIWYFHHYATPYSIPGLHRPFEFGSEFVKKGSQVTVFTSSYLHYNSCNMITDSRKMLIKKYGNVYSVYIRTSGYNSSGLKRIFNMFQFYQGLFYSSKKIAKQFGKPDIIIASSPHPLTMMAGNSISKKFSIPCICEVRDFWPEVIFLAGKLSEDSFLGKILLSKEKNIYTDCDALLFLKEGDYKYLCEHKWSKPEGNIDLKKCYYVNNGVDINLFDERLKKYHIDNDPELNDNCFKIVYCGAIRPVNNVDLLLDVGKILGNKAKILIYGEGNCVENLKKRIEKEKINNVFLKGYVENKFIPYILSKSSLNILNYSSTNYNWTRGNSSNKLFEYLASGKPVVSTIKMGYDLLSRYTCGLSPNECTPKGIAQVIDHFINMTPEQYKLFCRNARKTAELFDIPKLANLYYAILCETIDRYNNR